MPKQPWLKWYPSDWRADPLVRACAPLTRYVWVEMLGLMHEAEPYGHLVIGGRTMDNETLSRVIAVDLGDVKRAVRELKDRGVCGRRDDGVIFSRRMVRDKNRAEINRKNGKDGGNPCLIKQGLSNGSVNPPDKPPDKTQKPEARSQKPETSDQKTSDHVSPLPREARDEFDRFEALLRKAGKLETHPSPGLIDTSPIAKLMADGYSLEAVILPKIRAMAARKRDGWETWDYVARSVRKAHPFKAVGLTSDDWANRLAIARKRREWDIRNWGPMPGQGDCRVPVSMLRAGDGDGWTEWRAAA